MSEKIEINTLITKHENKCKGCRFEMIDVEDPLWEYGSPLKRVLIDNQTGETYDSVSELVGLLNEQQATIIELQEIIIDLKDDKNQLHKVISKLRQEVAELETRNSVLSSKLNQIPKSIKEVWLE